MLLAIFYTITSNKISKLIYMSNLNNVYTTCPGLMSDGRAQPTDYKSHNTLFNTMKGTFETSFEFREKLQGSGLRDLTEGVRFNLCDTVPAGDIVLDPKINLIIDNTGSFLDAFNPLPGKSNKRFMPEPVESVESVEPVLPEEFGNKRNRSNFERLNKIKKNGPI